ncbi:MAG: hypothetical protein ACRDHL_08995 [Candidatus Promineifilaceae bacterium]
MSWPGLDCAPAGGFTGHAHNSRPPDGVGLIYMNARFYVPAVGRFASADTLVPDPARPTAASPATSTTTGRRTGSG